MSVVLEVSDLRRRYGDLPALDGATLAVGRGEIVGLLGANGAGKSTLMRICAGLQPPDAGVVRVDGVDVWQEPDKAKRHIGYAADEPAWYEPLSAGEHLAFLATVRGLNPEDARRRAAALCEQLGLAGRIDEPVERFSHGMRKKLSLAAALLHRPLLLLCDEAIEGFDISAAIAAKELLRAHASEGAAILFSSHVAETVERLCDRVLLLHAGRVVRVMTRAEWETTPAAPSALEGAFLSVARGAA